MLDGVDLELESGSITSLVGRSGSGKSTLARCLALLEEPDEGKLRVVGEDPWRAKKQRLAQLRRSCQLVVQDPVRAMQPSWTAARVVAEPLRIVGMNRAEAKLRAMGLMTELELETSTLADRPARSLSGGQVQRLALARALAAEPKLLILDETLSGLDLSLRAQIVNLLLHSREKRELTLLLISHDRALADHVGDRTLELAAGKLRQVGRHG